MHLNRVSVCLLRFYGKNSSYVHGGLDSNGKPVEAVYGQSVSGHIRAFKVSTERKTKIKVSFIDFKVKSELHLFKKIYYLEVTYKVALS